MQKVLLLTEAEVARLFGVTTHTTPSRPTHPRRPDRASSMSVCCIASARSPTC